MFLPEDKPSAVLRVSSYPVPLSARCSGSSMSRGLPVTAFVSSMTRVTLLTKTSLCDDRGGVDDDVFVELKEMFQN